MKRCLELAQQAGTAVGLNPLVGSVVFDARGSCIAEGHHRQYGAWHAEREALLSLPNLDRARGGTLYVNLEPCNHQGKTPACTDIILEAGISRVVLAMTDPNPRVSGQGIARLREAGVEVIEGILEHDARILNRRFWVNQIQKRAFAHAKWAETANGFMGSGVASQRLKISGDWAREQLLDLRDQEMAILVGVGTFNADMPGLFGRQTRAQRVVLDARLEGQYSAYNGDLSREWWVLHECSSAPEIKGFRFVQLPDTRSAEQVLQYLLKEGLGSVMIEGGRQVLDAFLNQGMVDEISRFTSHSHWSPAAHNAALKAPDARSFKGESMGNWTCQNGEGDALHTWKRTL